MAQTGRRQENQLTVAQTSKELALLGSEAGKDYTAADIENLFKTDARACKKQQDRWLYFVKCQAMGLSPFAKQLHAVERTSNKGKPNEYKSVIFMVSYHVYVSRARQAGYVPVAAVVCENDEWGGWDAVNSRPIKHISPAKNRGPILGAWVVMKRELDALVMTGRWLEYKELVLSSAGSPSWQKMPMRMSLKSMVLEGCRMIAPDLAAVMGAEEVGYSIEENPTKELTVYTGTPKEQLDAQAEEQNAPIIPSQEETVVDPETGKEAEPDPGERLISRSESSDLIAAFTVAGLKTTPDILKACVEVSGREITRLGELKKCDYDAILTAMQEVK